MIVVIIVEYEHEKEHEKSETTSKEKIDLLEATIRPPHRLVRATAGIVASILKMRGGSKALP